MKINQYIDHTLLKPIATISDIKTLCNEAIEYNFYAVCINGSYVNIAHDLLKNSFINITSVVGFPLGTNSTKSKLFEAHDSMNEGATEIDMVLNIGLLKSGSFQLVEKEISEIKKIIGVHTLKVIFENCYLSNDEKIMACKIALNTGADFIKTSTGFGIGGATIEDVRLMKKVVKNQIKIKASGGIKDFETAKEYLNLGVSRIGTSSGVTIMNQKIKL